LVLIARFKRKKMKAQTAQHNTETKKYILPLLISIVITLFLFYIDEGFYNFKWMLNVGNWIAFLVYVAAIYIAQLLLILPLFRFFPNFMLTATKFILIIFTLLHLVFIFSH